MCQRIHSIHASILVWLARTAKGSTSIGTETKLDHSSCLAIHKIGITYDLASYAQIE